VLKINGQGGTKKGPNNYSCVSAKEDVGPIKTRLPWPSMT